MSSARCFVPLPPHCRSKCCNGPPSCQVLPLLQEQAVHQVAVLPWCAGSVPTFAVIRCGMQAWGPPQGAVLYCTPAAHAGLCSAVLRLFCAAVCFHVCTAVVCTVSMWKWGVSSRTRGEKRRKRSCRCSLLLLHSLPLPRRVCADTVFCVRSVIRRSVDCDFALLFCTHLCLCALSVCVCALCRQSRHFFRRLSVPRCPFPSILSLFLLLFLLSSFSFYSVFLFLSLSISLSSLPPCRCRFSYHDVCRRGSVPLPLLIILLLPLRLQDPHL